MSVINNLESFKEATKKLIEGFKIKVAKHDYSRVNLSILENIKIDYFGTMSSIKYMVNTKKGDKGEVLLIPFDKKQLEDIYKAISASKTDWIIILQKDSIRLHAPLPTTESKKKVQKIINEETEQAKIQLRQYRHKLLDFYKKNEKDEDDLVMLKVNLEKLMTKFENDLKQISKETTIRLFKV